MWRKTLHRPAGRSPWLVLDRWASVLPRHYCGQASTFREFDISTDACARFEDAGGTACAGPAEAAKSAFAVVSVVVNAQQTEAALFGGGGGASGVGAGHSVYLLRHDGARAGPVARRPG